MLRFLSIFNNWLFYSSIQLSNNLQDLHCWVFLLTVRFISRKYAVWLILKTFQEMRYFVSLNPTHVFTYLVFLFQICFQILFSVEISAFNLGKFSDTFWRWDAFYHYLEYELSKNIMCCYIKIKTHPFFIP